MPIFEYQCNQCKVDFEKLVYGSNPDVNCPKCSSRNIRKKLSLFGMSGVEKQTSSGANCNTCTASTCQSCH